MRAIIDKGTVEERRRVVHLAIHGATVWRKGVEPHDVPGIDGGLRGDPIDDRVEVAFRTLIS